MPYKQFFEGGNEAQNLNELVRFLTDSTIKILWKHAETLMFKQKDKGIYGKTIFYVFYQDIKEELQQELSDFKNKLEIAKQVSMDERYHILKNLKQRELFLLSEYFLSKSEAQDVIELLKPEIAKIISDSEKNEEEDVVPIVVEKLSEKMLENKVTVPTAPKIKVAVPIVSKAKETPKKVTEEEIDREMKEIEKELE